MINILNLLFFYFVKIAFFVCCCSFIWAGAFFFKKPSKTNSRFFLINFFGLLAIGFNIFFVYNASENNCYFVGGILAFLSLLLFWLAIRECKSVVMRFAFHDDSTQKNFVSTGPYRYIRHPFYASYTLAWAAGPLISGRYVELVPFSIIMFFLYYFAAKEEEQFFIDSNFNLDYRKYKESTGMFIPNLIKIYKFS